MCGVDPDGVDGDEGSELFIPTLRGRGRGRGQGERPTTHDQEYNTERNAINKSYTSMTSRLWKRDDYDSTEEVNGCDAFGVH